MVALRFDAEQRFTCQQCGRCCRRPWDIALTPAEAESYRRGRVARLYRDTPDGPEESDQDPFEPIPGRPQQVRIRKRADGACGFLSPENRCRIHEELGAQSKPLTCRLFPYRFDPADGPPVVTASFACPTVVKNEGATLGSQLTDVQALQKEWARTYPELESPIDCVKGRRMPRGSLGTLREVLRQMLDRPGPDQMPDLSANVARMAALLEDLSRPRVLALAPDRFAEYLELTGRFAAHSDKAVTAGALSRLARLLFRGFLFTVAAARIQLEHGRTWAARVRLARLLLHVHGLWPATGGYDLPAARRAGLSLADPDVRSLAHNYLRSQVETLGRGRRPVLAEIGLVVAFLNVACVLARMRTAQAGRDRVAAGAFAEALMDAVDLTHAEAGGALGWILATFSGGVDALWRFASGESV